MSLTPTAEQQAAIDLFRSGGSLALEAGAGTGKTSTLTLLADAMRPRQRGQYIAFNKAIVTDSAAKFPGHVTASTAHSLAFRAVGYRYKHRLQGGRMRSLEIARRLGIDPLAVAYGSERKMLSPDRLAGIVMRAVQRFCQSADLVPGEEHFPYVDGIDVPTPDGRRGWANNRNLRAWLEAPLQRAWRDLSDPAGQLPFGHDHYLKLWHLSEPRIGADVILFDEAQDANPVMVAVVAAQAHAQIVWVGDSQQAIYEFTGAVNALADVPADQRAFLTRSFRFGPAVALVANDVLELIDGAELRLVGSDAIASVVGPVADPDVVLCRTNATAVSRCLTLIREGRRPHLVGGAGDVVAFAKAAISLRDTGWTGHPDLGCFTSWPEVQEYVKLDEQGVDLRLMVDLVDEFTPEAILTNLDRMVPEQAADQIVSTAHKAKGREWASVQLAGDFRPADKGGLEPSELRLLYVAVTRARHELDVEAIRHILDDGALAALETDLAGRAPAVVEDLADASPAGVVATAVRPTCCPDCGRTDVVRPSGIIGAHRCHG